MTGQIALDAPQVGPLTGVMTMITPEGFTLVQRYNGRDMLGWSLVTEPIRPCDIRDALADAGHPIGPFIRRAEGVHWFPSAND